MTLVVGAGAADLASTLHTAGLTEVATLEAEISHSEFHDDAWVLHTAAGEHVRADVVIATNPRLFVPWVPDINGRNDFQGESFHAAAWDPRFRPAGKSIALVGTDSWAAHRLSQLVRAAGTVTVFAHAPRRMVSSARPWTPPWRRRPQPGPPVVTSAIDAITATTIRTRDGVEHPVDAIIYGTGFAIGDQAAVGESVRDNWVDGMEPFHGVAVRGLPNYFFLTGPDTAAQARYVASCLDVMKRTGSRRIEVRRSSQQVFNERVQLAPAQPPAVLGAFDTFDLSSSAPDYEDTYDGAATLEIGGARYPVRVRLVGHLDPLDGNYHWQGTVLDAVPDSLTRARAVTLSVGQHSVPARIVEQTPWGTHSVAGVGTPPYALA